jgi:hypothetical protein
MDRDLFIDSKSTPDLARFLLLLGFSERLVRHTCDVDFGNRDWQGEVGRLAALSCIDWHISRGES